MYSSENEKKPPFRTAEKWAAFLAAGGGEVAMICPPSPLDDERKEAYIRLVCAAFPEIGREYLHILSLRAK